MTTTRESTFQSAGFVPADIEPLVAGPRPEPTVTVRSRRYNVVVVGGPSRAGTHWLVELLGLHPHLAVRGEFGMLNLPTVIERASGSEYSPTSTEPYTTAAKRLLSRFYADFVGTIALAEELAGEVTHLGYYTSGPLTELVEGAPHVAIVRDPRDVVVSFTYHHLRQWDEMPERSERRDGKPVPIDPKSWNEAKAQWRENPVAGANALLAHEHWVQTLANGWVRSVSGIAGLLDAAEAGGPTPAAVTRYEDLHADASGERDRLLACMGLDPALARPIESEAKAQAGFSDGSAKSFYRKGQPGDWRNHETSLLCATLRETASGLMDRFGYKHE